MKYIVMLLALAGATYLIAIGVEGIVIFHSDPNVRVMWFSMFSIFIALVLVVLAVWQMIPVTPTQEEEPTT